MERVTLLAVILNYRTAELTLEAAEAALMALEGLSAELVIVDNDSGDGSFEHMRDVVSERFWPVRVLQSGHNGGFGAGNNFGMRAGLADGSTPDFYYILNSDAFPAKDSIRSLLNFMLAHPNFGIAGSYIHGRDGVAHETAFRFPSALGELEGAMRFGPVSRALEDKIVPLPVPSETVMVDWLAGASMMLRRQTIEEVGLFDEAFFLYYEETDLCRRAALAGWPTVYVRESEVAHIGSVSTGMKEWKRVPDYWFESRWHYFVKNHGRVYAIWATVLHLIGGSFHRVRSLLTGKQAAISRGFLGRMLGHMLRTGLSKQPTVKAPAITKRPCQQGDTP